MKTTTRAAILAAVIAGALGFTPAAFSQIIVTRSASAPTTDILFQSNSTGAGTGALSWQWTTDSPTNRRDLLQQFHYTPASDPSYVVDKINLLATGAYAIPEGAEVDFTLAINSYSSTSNATPLSNVATYTGVATRLGLGSQWWTFDVPDTTLDTSTLYGFVLSFTENGGASNYIPWQTFNGVGAFPDAGSAQINYGAGGTIFQTHDLNFIVQGSVVPEPSTASLILAGLVAAFGLKRRLARKVH